MEPDTFEAAYRRLNSAQREAVDTIEGPLLVVAGPGTGKTQLLAARVANILRTTDASPNNILCLTFTESGAANMRERLTRFIGQAAYDVQMSTYHAFGGEIIQRFPQYFTEHRLQNPVDNLGKHQILEHIVAALPYANPLKQTQHHIRDLVATISEAKRGLLTPDDLRKLAAENTAYIAALDKSLADIFQGFTRMPTKLDAALAYFEPLAAALADHVPADPAVPRFGTLGTIAHHELQQALQASHDTGKPKPLTSWKTKWLAKNADNQFVLAGELESHRIAALADVLEQYQQALAAQGLYDFDDMIIRAIQALEQHDALRYTLQEQYLYLLLDEFQDTNAAQLRLVELLTDNPVHEGRPNVMAVGDDDQAIYAFQGAAYSNMLDFYRLYRDTRVLNLAQNYRSHADILETAGHIAAQMSNRLFQQFDHTTKTLTAANDSLPPKADISRQEFLSEVAERDHVARHIAALIAAGTPPNEIAVLAPRHKYLEALVPYLRDQQIPVQYEKRENILETPTVMQLLTMSRLVLALNQRNHAAANALWPEVLSFPFWRVPVSKVWQLSWQARDTNTNWAELLLQQEGVMRAHALLFMTLALRVHTEPLEAMLDYLIGSAVLDTNETDLPRVSSPFREYYLSADVQAAQPEAFYDVLSHLAVMRTALHDRQLAAEKALTLADLLTLVDAYETAGEPLLNTNPHVHSDKAVQLMTVFKAKGLEFAHVFIIAALDSVWGSASRANSNRISLPANLAPIRYSGANEDERLRILFVAATRAKIGLHITSHTHTFSGKTTKRLKYLDEREQPDGGFVSHILPAPHNVVQHIEQDAPEQQTLELNWRHVHTPTDVSLRALLAERLEAYQLSPTHVTTFIDLEYGGPEQFFFRSILHFKTAPTVDSHFGTAMHETLEWVQHQLNETGTLPELSAIQTHFATRLAAKKLPAAQHDIQLARGQQALKHYMQARGGSFRPGDIAEANFKNEGAFVGDVHLGGKIDKLEIDHDAKTITVVDYKTGEGYTSWKRNAKLHKYELQLYCYKLLVEHSRTYKTYRVTHGRLEFVEPDRTGGATRPGLTLEFNDQKLDHARALMVAMWQHVHQLSFPDTSRYDSTLVGIEQFERDLIDGRM